MFLGHANVCPGCERNASRVPRQHDRNEEKEKGLEQGLSKDSLEMQKTPDKEEASKYPKAHPKSALITSQTQNTPCQKSRETARSYRQAPAQRQSDHATCVDGLWLADRHRHAQRLKAVVALRVTHADLLHHAVGRRRVVAVGH